jgi:hypothetical protein
LRSHKLQLDEPAHYVGQLFISNFPNQ